MQATVLAPALATLDLAAFMREALYEAEQAGLAGELPSGAVVVIDGQIISCGRARHKGQHNQLMHAELTALLAGGKRCGNTTTVRSSLPAPSLAPCAWEQP